MDVNTSKEATDNISLHTTKSSMLIIEAQPLDCNPHTLYNILINQREKYTSFSLLDTHIRIQSNNQQLTEVFISYA